MTDTADGDEGPFYFRQLHVTSGPKGSGAGVACCFATRGQRCQVTPAVASRKFDIGSR